MLKKCTRDTQQQQGEKPETFPQVERAGPKAIGRQTAHTNQEEEEFPSLPNKIYYIPP